MLLSKRLDKILETLNSDKNMTVKQLAAKMYVSEATMRRDLTKMEQLGFLKRYHGGAVVAEKTVEPSVIIRMEQNSAEKRRIAEAAAAEVTAYSSFMLDSSSTVKCLSDYWNIRHSVVFTTGIETAAVFSKISDTEVVIPGGVLKYNNYSVEGPLTLESINNFRADVLLCSCGAVGNDGFLTESSAEQCAIKKAMFKNCGVRILMFDKSKFSAARSFVSCNITEFNTVITDKSLPESLENICRNANVKVIVV